MTRTGNTVAVIGLGVMGAPMAANLIDAGYDVVGFNRSPGEGRDSRCTRRPRGILDRRSRRGVDVVLTVLPDTPDVDLAVTGEDGVFAHAEPGALWIDSSNARPDASVRLASIGRDNGIRALDAPLSGGEVGAKDLGIVTAAARDAGVAIPLGATAARRHHLPVLKCRGSPSRSERRQHS